MDDTLAGGLVESAVGLAGERGRGSGVAGVSGLAELANGGLQGGLDVLVAQARLLVGADALLLRLDVRHGRSSNSRKSRCATESGGAPQVSAPAKSTRTLGPPPEWPQPALLTSTADQHY